MPLAASTVSAPDLESQIAAIRRFNRFYTRQIGLLQEGYLDSPSSLSEVRVLWELAHTPGLTARDLMAELRLDRGYLSRMLAGFQRRGLIRRTRSDEDRRQYRIDLTDAGREAFAPLNARSRDDIAAMLAGLAEGQRARLDTAMTTIQQVLGDVPVSLEPFILRPHRPGDMGWVVHRHGVLYAREYGWDERFEALVARITADFIEHFQPQRERCWIAEREGETIGSVFLVRQTADAAKLRLLLVEPSARGLGVGSRLVAECIRFARDTGYRRITLWTNSGLVAARHIYTRAGFTLVAAEPHHSFGCDLVGETWELDLANTAT